MKTLRIIFPLLMCCCFEIICAESFTNSKKNDVAEWLEIKLEDVDEQCKKNVNYTIDQSIFYDYRMRMQDFLEPIVDENTDMANRTLKLIYNPYMVKKLKELIERIQNCLDDENRLNSKAFAEVLMRILHIHAKRVIMYEPPTAEEFRKCDYLLDDEKQMECGNKFGSLFKRPPYDKMTTIYDLLSGNYVGRSTCEELLPLSQCFMEAASLCSTKSKNVYLFMFSPAEVGMCENFSPKAHVKPILKNGIFETLQ